MFFGSPIWLLALIPWAGVALWLLWGRRRRTFVSFLNLWRGPALQKPPRRGVQVPPIFVAFALLALLLAVLAAGEPALRSAGPVLPLSVVVDRGTSMSAGLKEPRFVTAGRLAVSELLKAGIAATARVKIVGVPAEPPADVQLDQTPTSISRLLPTALVTRDELVSQVRQELTNPGRIVVVLSDQTLSIDDPRLLQISPGARPDDVAIVFMSARTQPIPAVMVRVRNNSPRMRIRLSISGSRIPISREIDLPPRDNERDYFFSLAEPLAGVLHASLSPAGDEPAHAEYWLARESSYPKIESRIPLSPEVRRMIDVYSQQRRSSGGVVVDVVGHEAQLPPDRPGIVLEQSNADAAVGDMSVIDHPVTRGVRWGSLGSTVQFSADVPAGWKPVLSLGGKPLIAVSDGPPRRAWVGFDMPPAFATSADFVVFWANVFDWVGAGADRFASHPLEEWNPDWKAINLRRLDQPVPDGQWPGIYQNADGSIRAFNAPVANISPATTTPNWSVRIAAAKKRQRGGENLASAAIILSILCLGVSAATWKRSNLTLDSASRTF